MSDAQRRQVALIYAKMALLLGALRDARGRGARYGDLDLLTRYLAFDGLRDRLARELARAGPQTFR